MAKRTLEDLQRQYNQKAALEKRGMPMGPRGGRGGPMPQGKPKNTAHTVRRLWGYVSAYKFRLVMVLFCMLISTLTSLIGGYMIAPIINRITLAVAPNAQIEFTPVGKIADGVIEKMYITAKKKNQSITYKPVNPVPIFKSNRDKLEQVVINIVSNAIKYTGDGGNIDVVSGRLYNDAFIKVIDNGIGIPKENLPRLFERFYRVDKARSRDTGGTGLGLAISKQIIEGLGGTITINSEFGQGTEVILTFPIL